MAKFRKACVYVTDSGKVRFSADELNEKVKVTCYRETKEMARGSAINFYSKGMCACDPNSSEYDRYCSIVSQLLERKTEVDDLWGC